MTISSKLQKVLSKLGQQYFPFNNLSPERLQEIVNHIRINELRQDEILQVRASTSEDYLYLLEGQIEVSCDRSALTLNNPEETQRCPVLLTEADHHCSIQARSNSIICRVNRAILDSIIAWDCIGCETEQPQEHMDLIRHTLVFRKLPMEVMERAFANMTRKTLPKGHAIHYRQSDAYYLILSGSAEVVIDEPPRNTRVIPLGRGDAFGKEALFTENPHPGELIVMTEDTELLVLEKHQYEQLVKQPLVRSVTPEVALTMLDNGYQLLDVRFPEEYAVNRIPGARLMPLNELLRRIGELDPNRPYIVYDHSGPRSAIAALILNRHKIEALSLEGGIREWPYDIEVPSSRVGVVARYGKLH